MIRALAALLLVAACGSRDGDHKEPPRDPERPRRVIEPPPDKMRPLPPHAIRADGIGPYKLGEKLSDLLDQLPSGPRIAVFDIPGLVHRNVIRAEDDAVLIGGEQGATASFAAVVGPEVARTESGIHVGSTRGELVRALGPLLEDPERARDPRVAVPGALPNARALFDGGRVAAIVVAAEPAKRGTAGPAAGDCARPAATDKAFGACLTPAGELVEADGDELTVRSADGERALGAARVAGLVFAAPLRNPADGKDEIAAVARVDGDARTWTLSLYRFEGRPESARFVRALDPAPLYTVTPANARWIGAELPAVDLYLELTSRTDSIEVGGLLTTRAGEKIRDVVVITPVSVPRHRGKGVPEGAGSAGSAAAGSNSANGSAAPGGGSAGAGSGSAAPDAKP